MNFENLEQKLTTLTGYDFETAERKCRKIGDITPDIAFSKNFAVLLAAKALDCKSEDIKALGLKEYVKITSTVSNFLFSDSVIENSQADATEK